MTQLQNFHGIEIMSQYYFLNQQNQQIGPIEKEQLIKTGITADTLVWTQGMAQWTPAGKVTDLAPMFIPTPPPPVSSMPPVPPPPVTPASNHENRQTIAPQQPFNPNFGTPATLYIDYPGNWSVPGWNIKLNVNGVDYGEFPFTEPMSFTITLTEPVAELKAKLWIRSAKLIFRVEPGKTYRVLLDYNRFLGSIKFKKFG